MPSIFRECKEAPRGEPQCIYSTRGFEHAADAAIAEKGRFTGVPFSDAVFYKTTASLLNG